MMLLDFFWKAFALWPHKYIDISYQKNNIPNIHKSEIHNNSSYRLQSQT